MIGKNSTTMFDSWANTTAPVDPHICCHSSSASDYNFIWIFECDIHLYMCEMVIKDC